MNDQYRKDLAAAFRAALLHLWDGMGYNDLGTLKQKFICLSLSTALEHGQITQIQWRGARNLITERLDGCETLGLWLAHHYPCKYNTSHKTQMQRTRKAWLESLVKEFESNP